MKCPPQDRWPSRTRVICFWFYLLRSTYYIDVSYAYVPVLNGHPWCYYIVPHRQVTFDKKVNSLIVISVLKNSNYCCILITYVCTCINGTPMHTFCTYDVCRCSVPEGQVTFEKRINYFCIKSVMRRKHTIHVIHINL
jgi:hypothetical protein